MRMTQTNSHTKRIGVSTNRIIRAERGSDNDFKNQLVTDNLYKICVKEFERIGAKETDELCDAFTAFLKAAYNATK